MRRRLALGAALGSLGGLVLAALEARWLRSGLAAPPPFADAMLAVAGLVVPVTLVVGLVVGFVSWFAHPRAEPSIGLWLEQLRGHSAGRPADVAAFAPLVILGLFFWATLSAQLARVVLAIQAPALLSGASIAAGSLGLGMLIALVVLALTPALRQKLAAGRSGWSRLVDPGTTSLLAVAVVAALVAFGVATGTVSGEGGLFGIYGILKRQELDLRVPAVLLGVAVAALLGPAKLGRVRPYQALVVALLPLALTARAATALNGPGDLARYIERGAPLAKIPLAVLRKLTDRDGDGASPYFGGGDCDDANAAIGPGVDDIPDNGVDEDCSGTDLSLEGLEPPVDGSAKPAGSGQPAEDDRLPQDANVVLITIDTLRYDLGYTGYERDYTPNLDKLAERSIVYERAYSLASYTGKSVGPMLSGKYGSETHRNWGHFNIFPPEDIMVAERLQKAGIRTVSVHGHRYFGKYSNLDRGFDVVDMSAAPPEGTSWETDKEVTSGDITDAAIAQLGEIGDDQRFFLWAHYLDPHADYKKHEGVPDFGNSARALYDADVAYTDQQIGRLLDVLAKKAYAPRTHIIVTSDHGEAFGENKMWRHGVELWEVLVRVPLIVHVPGLEARRIDVRRSLIDLVPTMLELMRVPMPSGEGDDFLSGQSWVPDWFGDAPEKRPVLVDMPAGPYNGARRAFIKDDLKLILLRGGQKKELYDLAEDPGETRNVWSTRKEEIEAHYALMKRRLKEIEVTGKFK